METPDTQAGRTTERIMAEWRRRLTDRGEPKPSTATYNAAYEAVLHVLSEPTPRDIVRYPEGDPSKPSASTEEGT